MSRKSSSQKRRSSQRKKMLKNLDPVLSQLEKGIDQIVEKTKKLTSNVIPFKKQQEKKSGYTFYLTIIIIFALLVGVSLLLYSLTTSK